jgi:hypothetical protein
MQYYASLVSNMYSLDAIRDIKHARLRVKVHLSSNRQMRLTRSLTHRKHLSFYYFCKYNSDISKTRTMAVAKCSHKHWIQNVRCIHNPT